MNLAAGNGHPAEMMDMSFAVQALSARFIAENRGKLPVDVIAVPREIDAEVAAVKLRAMGKTIDTLTREQKEYLGI